MRLTFGKHPIVLIVFSFFIFSCNKSSIPKPSNPIDTKPDTTSNTHADTSTHIYLAGFGGANSYEIYPLLWKDGFLRKIDTNGTRGSGAYCLAISDTDVYIGGSAGGGRATYWKNGLPPNFLNNGLGNGAVINKMAFKGSDLYAVGYEITTTNNMSLASVWKNGNQTYLTSFPTASAASSILFQGSDTYVTGNYSTGALIGPTIDYPCYWKNGVVQTLPTDVTPPPVSGRVNAFINGMALAGTDVYACGYTSSTAGKYVATYWKNGVEIKLTDGLADASITCIGVLGNDVYMGGFQASASGKSIAMLWKNGNPVLLTDGTEYAGVYAISIHRNDVYLAGLNGNSDGSISAVYWKNGIIHTLPGSSPLTRALGIIVTGGK